MVAVRVVAACGLRFVSSPGGRLVIILVHLRRRSVLKMPASHLTRPEPTKDQVVELGVPVKEC